MFKKMPLVPLPNCQRSRIPTDSTLPCSENAHPDGLEQKQPSSYSCFKPPPHSNLRSITFVAGWMNMLGAADSLVKHVCCNFPKNAETVPTTLHHKSRRGRRPAQVVPVGERPRQKLQPSAGADALGASARPDQKMETTGLEPATSAVQGRRSPS